MYSKAEIFNLALSALLLSRQIVDTDNDKSNECKVLNTHWKAALGATLQDLDLDSTSTPVTLEVITTDPNDLWKYAYKYPTNCAHLRRLQSCVDIDNRYTHITKRVAVHAGQKVILTNEDQAIAEIISTDVPLSSLSAQAGLALAYKLAVLSAPLITGKGAAKLRAEIQKEYLLAKAEAQEQDRLENANFTPDDIASEFVAERTS